MSAKDTTRLTSFLQRQVWFLYPELTGKAFRLEDIHDPKVQIVIKKFTKTFLPELQKMTGTKRKPPRNSREAAETGGESEWR